MFFASLLCNALASSGLKLLGSWVTAGQGHFALNIGPGDGWLTDVLGDGLCLSGQLRRQQQNNIRGKMQ